MTAAAQRDFLKEELTCSICLQVYTDPVILKCNHSFCQACIENLWKDTCTGFYSCPECQESFKVMALEKNFQLASIVRKYMCRVKSQIVVPCSYCTVQKFPAVKTCLKCEVSMCSVHLAPHQENVAFKSHLLTDPIADIAAGKCTEHQERLKLYCKDHAVCLCSLCVIVGAHKNHNLIGVSEAVKGLKNHLENQQSMIRVNIINVQENLEVLQNNQNSTLEMMCKVTRSIQEKYKIRREQLDNEEFLALQHLTREQSRIAMVIHDRILTLQNKVKEYEKALSDLAHIPMIDDILFIQKLHAIAPRMNKAAQILHNSTLKEMTKFPMEQTRELRDRGEMIKLYGQSLTLDPDTAHPSLILLNNNSIALASSDLQLYPESPHRFNDKHQVLCSVGVSYGRCYWEVETSKEVGWKVGVCYRSISRKGRSNECSLGKNEKSWCVQSGIFSSLALHNHFKTKLPNFRVYPALVGVFVDFECGMISFYAVSDDTLTHLHTFEQTFSEPLYPALEITNNVRVTMLTMEDYP
ncbi:E3 ubiquitin-protein ligase TRIM39-like isoform X2 [Scyliorhinus canicula]|uniref:E3 ubiquitin-protein ligase TRIM39-like isoform X2 n=1 Tax=Scyliorhinus canicula TaxID=7830 RepID=UPI0018F560B3|nr:E3 ubiquitin-protein ligase TRIM39-like isoform X2 [Scyliorhinus canicula]